MPEGPFGGPRPFASSEIIISYSSNVAESFTLTMTADERRDRIESLIRREADMNIDVKFTPAETVILTRKQNMPYGQLVVLVEAIKEVNEQLDIEIRGDINIVTDGK